MSTPDASLLLHTTRWRRSCSAVVFAVLALAACQQAPKVAEPAFRSPESASPQARERLADAGPFRHHAVAAANPLAAAAGEAILRAGGNAVDAAVAVQMVLGLVEPQSSGIGGGAFLLYWGGRGVEAWDGRETAPAAATPTLFLGTDGQPILFKAAVAGGRAVGVPGAVRMLEAAHRAHGRLPWARLFEPAIRLAEEGFAVSPRLNAVLTSDGDVLRADADARRYFLQPDGDAKKASPWQVGHVLTNPALAKVLRAIATQGSDALLSGPVAEAIVRKVRGHATNPGEMTVADLSGYRAVRRDALCTDWRRWRVCGMPPPSSGHLTIMQILAITDDVAGTEPPALGEPRVPGAEWLHDYLEASNLAFADRDLYIGDPAFVPPPAGDWQTLLEPGYLRTRAALVGPRHAGTARAGTPGGQVAAWAPQVAQPEHGTSHISIVDDDGHAVAMTTTIEAGFGTGLLVDGGTGLPGGFLLNNELTDFSFRPTDDQGRVVANRVEPGKRPRSSMSPTLVFDRASGRLVMSLGSPGGAVIIHYTAKAMMATLGWGLTPQAAIDLPNFGSFNGPAVLEAGRFPTATVQALTARGHDVQQVPLTSGLQALQRLPDGTGWIGGSDRRREGVVLGR